jgi:hypothetical protein
MTTMTTETEDIEQAARKMAAANITAAPETEAIYFFPAVGEIRLIETDPTTLPSEEIVPYYFGAAPQSGIPYRSSVALIRPEEVGQLSPPPGWGNWSDAIRLWPSE